MSSLKVIAEPELVFAQGQRSPYPCDGLSIFGPYGESIGATVACSYVAIGTATGLKAFKSWSAVMNRAWYDAPNENYRLWPAFPGFESAFGCSWPSNPVREFEIDEEKLIHYSRLRDPHERASEVVQQFVESLRIVGEKMEENIGVAICVVPDEIYTNCRMESKLVNPVGEAISRSEMKDRKAGQLSLLDDTPKVNPEIYNLSPDFRRQLKALAMKWNTPVQIIRESTLRITAPEFGERQLTPISDRMWNMGSGLFYKSGGKPWKLATARPGVCYVGIAFRMADSKAPGNTACCAAQMFLDSGDGVVFKGEFGPWYSSKTKDFQLTQESARNLLQGVLETYRDLQGQPVKEVFIHSRSRISRREYEGYVSACDSDTKVVGVRVQSDKSGARLYRVGKMPMVRGTLWALSERSGYLFGSGFKPRLGTYDGWEVPVPLRVDIQHGDAHIDTVAKDILSLTKLNYNSCRFGDSQPVTVGFSDKVGEILVSNPGAGVGRPQFRYYI